MSHSRLFPHFDVVIAGASFAGAACALAAAQRGLRVCVLERKHDPGERLHTTGIIVKEAAEKTALNAMPHELVQRVERVRLYAPNLNSLALAAPGYYFWTTDTPNVMRWLAQRLRDAGVVLRLGTSFTGATACRDEWRVDGAGTTRYLVGADGARSRVAAHIGLGRVREFLYGVEHEFPGAQLPEPDALHCFISKHYAPGYIGWVAQNPTGVQVGLALRHDARHARTPDIEGFIARVRGPVGLAADARRGAVRAGLIPCGGPVTPLSKPGVVLTGDAAGIVSPVTAGGIHSAWEHGWTLGQAIAAHLQDDGPEPERVAQTAAPRFRIKRALRWAFDRFQYDWAFDALLYSAPLRWAAEQVYFHQRCQRDMAVPSASRDECPSAHPDFEQHS